MIGLNFCSDDTIGVELEIGIVNREFKKPMEPKASAALLNLAELMIDYNEEGQRSLVKVSAVDSANNLERRTVRLKHLHSIIGGQNIFEDTDLGHRSPVCHAREFIESTIGRYAHKTLMGFVDREYKKYINAWTRGEGLLPWLDFAQTRDHIRIINELRDLIGLAAKDKIACVCSQIMREVKDPNIAYDPSDALEIKTPPLHTADEIRTSLMQSLSQIEGLLFNNGLGIVFAGRYPFLFDERKKNWLEKDQTYTHIHFHFGRSKSIEEAVHVYKVYRNLAPEIICLFNNYPITNEDDIFTPFFRYSTPPLISTFSQTDLLKREITKVFGANAKYERTANLSIKKVIKMRKNESDVIDNHPRIQSTVFMRPEYGTVEVRVIDTQNTHNYNSLESHVESNMVAIDFVDAIGKAALAEYCTLRKDDSKASYEINEMMKVAYLHGLEDKLLYYSSLNLYERIRKYLQHSTCTEIESRLSSRLNPAQAQIKLLNTEGIEGLQRTMTYFPNIKENVDNVDMGR